MKTPKTESLVLILAFVLLTAGCASGGAVSNDPVNTTGVATSTTPTTEARPANSYYKAPAVVDPRVEEALRLFRSGEYDEALPQLKTLVADMAVTPSDRRQMHIALTEWYSATGETGKATEQLALLFTEEPPIFEPNPDEFSLDFLKAYYSARKNQTGGFGVERPDPGIQTIAVMDFQNASFSADAANYDRLGIGLPQILLFQFQSNVNLKVVERERLEWVLQENEMQQDSERFNQESAVRAGKLLGANSVVFGTFVVTNKNKVRITARVVKVETSEILEVLRPIEGKVDDILDLADQLAVSLARQLNASESLGKVEDPTNSLDAMLAYAEGLDIYYTQGPAHALEKFKLALQFDDGFEKARQKIVVLEESTTMMMASARN